MWVRTGTRRVGQKRLATVGPQVPLLKGVLNTFITQHYLRLRRAPNGGWTSEDKPKEEQRQSFVGQSGSMVIKNCWLSLQSKRKVDRQ